MDEHALNMIEAKAGILTRQTDQDTSFLSTNQHSEGSTPVIFAISFKA